MNFENNPMGNNKGIMRVGYSYVPYQNMGKLYPVDKALTRRTKFPELDITIEEYERGQ